MTTLRHAGRRDRDRGAGAAPPELAADDPRRPLDPRDYSRRTLLANERTYLAWWRTGLTTLTVALAAARIVPEVSDAGTTWPYSAMGVAFALIGIFCVVVGERRRRAVSRAVKRGEFAELDDGLGLVLTVAAVVLGLGMVTVIVVGA